MKKPTPFQLACAPNSFFDNELKRLKKLKDKKEKPHPIDLLFVERKHGRHHARFLPEDIPQHIVSRVFQGRFLLRPTPKLLSITVGVLAKAKKLYPNVKLYAAAYLSNHFHLMLQGPPEAIARFVAFSKREISRRWGKEPDINWPGTMWDRYLSTALPTRASQFQCLKYILSHGVKEGLVEHPEDWTGMHCARALANDEPMTGVWFDGTGYGRAKHEATRRVSPQPINRADFEEDEVLYFDRMPAWGRATVAQVKRAIRDIIARIVVDGRKKRKGKPPMGMKKVLRQPINRRSALPPQPWFEERKLKLVAWGNPTRGATRRYIERYWAFQGEFESASNYFLETRSSLQANFPREAFMPSLARAASVA